MIDPIFIAEAAVNGILLGGILALLALGLNLIFGVIDIVWIAYVDLVMLCMYGDVLPRAGVRLAGLGRGPGLARSWAPLLGVGVHLLIITPILGSPPVNQLLATGGLLFFIQSFATLPLDHRPQDRAPVPAYHRGGRIFLPARRSSPS